MQIQSDWYTTFFSGMALGTIRTMFPEEHTRNEASFIAARLALPPGSRILDVPCGAGRLSLELAARGFRLHGVDLAGPLVEEARAVAVSRGLDASFERRDMRDLPFPAEFDGAFCFGHSFDYFTDEGNEEFLRAVSGSLRRGGRFILDAPLNAETLSSVAVMNSWGMLGEVRVLRNASLDHRRGRLEVEYTFQRGAESETKGASYRVYTIRQLLELLQRTGFSSVEDLGSLAGEPFRFGAKGLYLVATKG